MDPRIARRGQAKAEYIIVIVLVAIATLIAVKFFGRTLYRKNVESGDTVNTHLVTNVD